MEHFGAECEPGPSGLQRNEEDGFETDSSDEDEFPKYYEEKRSSEDSDSSQIVDAEKCSICLAKFSFQEKGSPEGCDHVFCVECLLEWARKVNTCPIDRREFENIVIVEDGDRRIIPIEATSNRQSDREEVPVYCEICFQSNREQVLFLCESCDDAYHLDCLDPASSFILSETWFCPNCRPAEARVSDPIPETGPVLRRRPIPRTLHSERVRRTIVRSRRTRSEWQCEYQTTDTDSEPALQTSRPKSVKKSKAKRKRRGKKRTRQKVKKARPWLFKYKETNTETSCVMSKLKKTCATIPTLSVLGNNYNLDDYVPASSDEAEPSAESKNNEIVDNEINSSGDLLTQILHQQSLLATDELNQITIDISGRLMRSFNTAENPNKTGLVEEEKIMVEDDREGGVRFSEDQLRSQNGLGINSSDSEDDRLIINEDAETNEDTVVVKAVDTSKAEDTINDEDSIKDEETIEDAEMLKPTLPRLSIEELGTEEISDLSEKEVLGTEPISDFNENFTDLSTLEEGEIHSEIRSASRKTMGAKTPAYHRAEEGEILDRDKKQPIEKQDAEQQWTMRRHCPAQPQPTRFSDPNYFDRYSRKRSFNEISSVICKKPKSPLRQEKKKLLSTIEKPEKSVAERENIYVTLNFDSDSERKVSTEKWREEYFPMPFSQDFSSPPPPPKVTYYQLTPPPKKREKCQKKSSTKKSSKVKKRHVNKKTIIQETVTEDSMEISKSKVAQEVQPIRSIDITEESEEKTVGPSLLSVPVEVESTIEMCQSPQRIAEDKTDVEAPSMCQENQEELSFLEDDYAKPYSPPLADILKVLESCGNQNYYRDTMDLNEVEPESEANQSSVLPENSPQISNGEMSPKTPPLLSELPESQSSKTETEINTKAGKIKVSVVVVANDSDHEENIELPVKKQLQVHDVADFVKPFVKKYYNDRKITKEEYKMIMRKVVPKVFRGSPHSINAEKAKQFVCEYVVHFIGKRK